MKRNMVRTALIQMPCGPGPQANLGKAAAAVQKAAAGGAKIVCLQELFRTPYFCQEKNTKYFEWAETVPGPSTDFFSAAAKKSKVVIITPLFEKKARGIYHNTAAVVDADGRYLGKYRKMHIPYDPLFYEKFYFRPGDIGFQVFKTKYAKIAPMICYDQWFPEAARTAALKGAEIIFYPTAIGWKPGRVKETKEYHASWECVQRGHAIANGVFVASVNRVGREGKLRFWGQSFVADPFGKILKRASASREELLLVDCDLGYIKKTRREWPFLRDRRTDAYR